MPAKPHSYPRSHRLSGRLAFAAVYELRVPQSRGPLKMFTLANGLSHCRWGLSVSRAVGNAVVRNRVKRLLREAIRLSPKDVAIGLDAVIVVRPHQPMPLAEYQKSLLAMMSRSQNHWKARPATTDPKSDSETKR